MPTPLLGAPVLTNGQNLPETTVNLLGRYLEAFASRVIIEDRDLLAAPALVDGKAYLVAGVPGAGDPWETHGGKIALAINTSWVFVAVREGLEIEVLDEDASFVRRGGAWVQVLASGSAPESVIVAMSDMATALTVGGGKAAWVAPYDFTLSEVFIALVGAQSSAGDVTIDASVGGATIFATPPSIQAGESTSLTGTAAILSDPSLVKGDIVLLDIDAAGTGAKGLMAVFVGTRG